MKQGLMVVVTFAVGALAVLPGCGSSSEANTRTVASASSVSTAAPTAASSPIAYGQPGAEAVYVTATATFSVSDGEVTTDPDGTMHTRGGKATATLKGNDPRFTGTEVSTWNTDRWGTDPSNGAMTQWGKTVFTTEGGTWVGPYSGVYTSETTDLITWWLTGEGGYAGMSLFMWFSESDANTATGVYRGLIFPGDPPNND
jgi:hypothetical protein